MLATQEEKGKATMFFLFLLLLSSGFVAEARLPKHQCRHGAPWKFDDAETYGDWLMDADLIRETLSESWSIPNREKINLDLPPEQRWLEIGAKYANQSYKIVEYFETFLPESVIKVLVEAAEKKVIANYSGFGDYALEMQGYATGLNISLGYIVLANLVYQLEHLGVACDNWNVTGPTGECWFSKKQTNKGPKGLCTSVVADDKDNRIFHGRNLDWNLEDDIKSLIIDVDFYKNASILYTGTTIVSFVGILNAAAPGRFSYSLDARCQGGHLIVNLIEAITKGAATPTQHARSIFDTADDIADFDGFIQAMSSGNLVDDAYYILGGLSQDEGAVVTRGRNRAVDVWRIGDTSNSSSWYRLETNYDHWLPAPSADDRRTPGMANMENLTQNGVSVSGLFDHVLSVWPTLNPHTDVSCVMAPWNATYECRVWGASS
eukprot:CAMPEP_0197322882 /NCGR_PEP_ID=MMETSP0891-20130614/70173_1 /TAXON_ID=44058 ORGANISM="Aureoumbra lagunensis, Strain CCMP1510" /NCGR_SAMPLE_ID=MMETSP0891 /ASSEMBLY_ACC=CAM_ASM_000534 /LENGTH=433 /DNA_ID=CAMNT_0042815389 /DNA_START=1 /DNA_END=1302 /DNA_ORIENTATION=-